ncbi:MAG: ribonuclease P protein subunit [Candidatus Woesearchaeota archaeon]|jgi:RNase P/RNase MRP subunit p29
MNKHQQEFIGKQIIITKTNNKQQQNITGTIINETKYTFTIKTQDKKIMILKSDKDFRINNQKIEGNKITKRPEERIKIKEK